MKPLAKVWIGLGLAWAAVYAGPLDALRADRPAALIKIGILQNARSLNLGAEKDFTVSEASGGHSGALSSASGFQVRPVEGGIQVGDEVFQGALRVRPGSRGGFLKVNGRRYRGDLLLEPAGEGRITVVDELGLDEYLYGVLPEEVSYAWPEESLKAQAVVSRTFALRNLGRHESEGFNLCSRVHCQVYGGLEAEREETNRAVDETGGEVALYQGDLANTVFFSNCGGRTEDPRNAWESEGMPPYLRSVRCRYCRSEKHYHWQARVSQAALAAALGKMDKKFEGPVRSIKIARKGRSGRAHWLKIRHANGESLVLASHFRLALGADQIRSTLFTDIGKSKGGFLFEGRGWGHGVGLCQEGAKGQALHGAGYKKIIRFYYPGVKVKRVDD